MRITDDIVMFIPACGLGERLAARNSQKPFIHINDGHFSDQPREAMALDRVMAQTPAGIDIEIALRKDSGFPRTQRGCTVHFMDPTTGQADTIYQWLRRTRTREYVLISNCDNCIDTRSIEEGIASLSSADGIRGLVYTFTPTAEGDERWSYLKTDSKHCITEIVEKKAISYEAVAGVYLLNMFALRMALYPEDIYLSQALDRMKGLYARRAEHYEGWNDLEQLADLEHGIKQYV